jgi:hypothetical protein
MLGFGSLSLPQQQLLVDAVEGRPGATARGGRRIERRKARAGGMK